VPCVERVWPLLAGKNVRPVVHQVFAVRAAQPSRLRRERIRDGEQCAYRKLIQNTHEKEIDCGRWEMDDHADAALLDTMHAGLPAAACLVPASVPLRICTRSFQ